MSTKLTTTLDCAKGLFQRGTDCFVRQLGFEVGEVPPIPLSEEWLKHLRSLGACLVLDGPITMVALHDQLDNKLGEGKLLYDTSWYRENQFYLTEAPSVWSWRVTMKKFVPDSTSKNYLQQTKLLAEYIKTWVFANQSLPKKFQQAIEEFNNQEKSLIELMNEDWQKAAEQLVGLQLNQLGRETAGQVLWSIVLSKEVNNEYLLPGIWTWTKSRSAGGGLVSVGEASADGVGVVSSSPGYSDGGLGVRFSCRASDLSG